MEYPDLSPYEYQGFPIPMLTVGWLGRKRGVPGGDGPPLAAEDLALLESASRRVGSVTLGTHECEFCVVGSAFEGNGEYRYYARGGTVFAAPMMVLHYVKQHGYRPPREFLEILHGVCRLDWDWRADRLVQVLLDQSEDVSLRCEAAVDLPNWVDPRALDALKVAAADEMLVDAVGDEVGRSVGMLLHCEFADGIRVEDFPDFVRFVIDQACQEAQRR